MESYTITSDDWQKIIEYAKTESTKLYVNKKLPQNWISFSIDEIQSEIIYACIAVAKSYKLGKTTFVQYCKIYASKLAVSNIWRQYIKWKTEQDLPEDIIDSLNKTMNFRIQFQQRDRIKYIMRCIHDQLSKDDLEVLVLNLAGYSKEEICKVLNVSRTYVDNVYNKVRQIVIESDQS